jgi:hypothetical protein
MIGVAASTFSVTIAAVVYTSGQYGPRLLSNFMSDSGDQVTLGTFIATLVYSLVVPRTIRSTASRNDATQRIASSALLMWHCLTGSCCVAIKLLGRSSFFSSARLYQWLADPVLTAHRFHAMRKIVSRLVSFYDARRCIEPDDRTLRMSRYFSAINGLMGEMHDKFIERAMAGNKTTTVTPWSCQPVFSKCCERLPRHILICTAARTGRPALRCASRQNDAPRQLYTPARSREPSNLRHRR